MMRLAATVHVHQLTLLLHILGAWHRRAFGAERMVTTTRGPGQFIGEASLFEGGHGDATWKTSVRARGQVKALLLTRSHLRSLLKQRPEAEAAVRAGAEPSFLVPVFVVTSLQRFLTWRDRKAQCCLQRAVLIACIGQQVAVQALLAAWHSCLG